MRFLGIILRVLRLDVSVWISEAIGRGVWLLQGFPPFSFTVYSKFTEEICKRLREFEEMRQSLREFEAIEISRQSYSGECVNSKEEHS